MDYLKFYGAAMCVHVCKIEVMVWYSPVTTLHTRDLSRVVPRVIQHEEKICHV